jgi:hypothetical protein
VTARHSYEEVAVSPSPGQVRDEAFYLLTGGYAESFGAAEIYGVGLDEFASS